MSEPFDDPSATARRLNDLRNRVLAGDEIEPAEYAEIIAALRANRMSAGQATARTRTKGLVVPIDLTEL